METDYLAAERTLAEAEQIAWDNQWWETLARLYMPLQESRRQIRQRCGEGIVRLDLWPKNQTQSDPADETLKKYPHGQLLLAGPATIQPAIDFRRIAAAQSCYVETFLAATYSVHGQRAIVIVGLEDTPMPPDEPFPTPAHLQSRLPAHSLLLGEAELPAGAHPGNATTYATVMSLWERLHRPYMDLADAESDPLRQMAAYRQAIRVDRACELAHQKLADVAKRMDRRK